MPQLNRLIVANAAILIAILPLARGGEPLPPAVEPARVVIECEDMTGVAQDKFGPAANWQVGRWGQDLYQNSVFGGVWASRLRVAMADKSDSPSEAFSDVTVPAAGTYKVWVKYECPPFFNYAFNIRISPLNGEGAAGKEIFAKTYGLIDAPKHFSFTKTLTRGSLYWTWGIDHDAAEGYETRLEAGRYRVTLSKAPNPAPAGARSVDAILITSDLSELSAPHFPRYPLLDELRRANHLYFRFRNLSQQPGRVTWNHWGHRYDDFYSAQYRERVQYFDADGKPLEAKDKSGNWPEPIAPGAASVWHDLGPTMNVESTSPFMVSMAAADPKAPKSAESLPFAVDIATKPNAGKIVKSFTLDVGEPDLVFLVQPDIYRKEGQEFSGKLTDIYRALTAQLNAEPRIGPIPKKIKIFGSTSGPRSPHQDTAITQGFRHALGLNTLEGNNFDKGKIEEIAAWWDKHGGFVRRSLVFQHSQEPKEVAERVKKAGIEDYFHMVSFGDEIGLPPVDVKDAAAVAAYRDFIKAHGETPQSLGVGTSWEQVKPLASLSPAVAVQAGVIPADAPKTDEQAKTLKRLFWYSHLFQEQRGIESFAAKTRAMKSLLGPDVQTSANLGGMHPFYWMHQASFIDSFKGDAMSLAWSEDYTYMQPEGSHLVADFEAAFLRKGASYHDTRMMFYCMPHFPGNTPQGLMQNAVLQWANNVKDFDWFSASPDAWSTENYVAYRGGLPTWKMLRTLSGMAGLIEDDLLAARPDPTPIAMLLSESSDVWELEGGSQNDVHPAERAANGTAAKPASIASNVSQEERKALWYALRQAGYRVDFVTENDVKEVLLKNYKLVYICGQNLERKAAAKIKRWVEDGGIVFGTAGAARKDEFDAPLMELDDVLGRGAQKAYQRYRGALRAKLELLFEKPLDRAGTGDYAIDALCSKEEFEPSAKAEVLARYAKDQSAAWVKNSYGKGTGYYIGTLPGQAFLKSALPVVPMGKGGSETSSSLFEPVDYNQVAQRMILRPISDANDAGAVGPPDVAVAHRCVVTGRLSSAKSTLIPIVNLAEQHDGKLQDLSISVRRVKQTPQRVWSCFYPKGMPFILDGDTLAVTLPSLQTADVIVISY